MAFSGMKINPAPFLGAINRDLSRIFKSGAIHVFILIVGLRGVSLIQQVGLARILDQKELGTAFFVLRIINIVCVFADFGLSTSVLKYASENVNESTKREIYRTCLIGTLYLSVLTSLAYVAIVYYTNSFGDQNISAALYLFSLYIPFAALRGIPPTYLQARKKLQQSTVVSGVIQLILVVFILGAAYTYGLWGFFVVLVFSQPVSFFIFAYITRADFLGVKCKYETLKKLINFGSFSLLANFTGTINVTLGVILLKWLEIGYEEIAIYGVANVIVETMRMAPRSLLQTFFPYLVAVKDDVKALRNKVNEIMVKQGAAVLFMSMFVCFVGYWMIPILFGDEYASSWPCVLILSAELIFWSVGSPFGKLQMALGHVRLNFALSSIQLVANCFLSFFLIPQFGAIGAAMALLLSRILHCGLQVTAGYKALNTIA